jgi:hypothetical protein
MWPSSCGPTRSFGEQRRCRSWSTTPIAIVRLSDPRVLSIGLAMPTRPQSITRGGRPGERCPALMLHPHQFLDERGLC